MIRRRRWVWLCVTLASVSLSAGCGGGEAGTASSGHIAFTVNSSGFGEIWIMDSDGGNRTRLTPAGEAPTDAAGSTSPAWSPNGELIAYASTGDALEEDQLDFEIYVMRADGGEPQRLTNDRVLDATPAWSPDGTRIAFAHLPGWGTEDLDGVIALVDTDGQNRAQLTRHPEAEMTFDADPAWSPDGELVAFTRTTFLPDLVIRSAIFMIEPMGENERLLVDDGADPAWSPDGRLVAFTSTRDRNGETCFEECRVNGEIYVMRSDGTDLRRLTTDEADDRSPAWSPDGTQIVFVSDRSNRANHENEIYVMAADGGDVKRITTNGVWDLEPAWR
jgi:TolB protein